MSKIKYRGSHNSLIPFAREICELIRPLGVSVSPGLISPGKTSSRSVKISRGAGWIDLAIKQSATTQEVRVFSNEANAMLRIARVLRDHDVHVTF